ncbi:TPA: hypothetical protein EYP44_04660 [Candidatus Bathyarchaeota archaeon]|nr:hypothetical protein [Candidatus Bathyarchaeota archaeon]
MQERVQCPCGRIITNADEYNLLFLKKEMYEIDILCPNDSCYLRELGYVKFEMRGDAARFKEASFYPPFVTWNTARLGDDAMRLLKGQLRDIVVKVIDWAKIARDTKAAMG